MKHFPFVLFAMIFFSCKKNSAERFDPASVKLKNVELSVPTSQSTLNRSVEYDNGGRIVKIFEPGNARTVTVISYANDQVILNLPVSEMMKETHEIRYTVNAMGLPVKRIERHFFNVTDSASGYTLTNSYDTTFFEYSASNLLSRSNRITHDTTTGFFGSQSTINIKKSVISKEFKNEGTVLKTIVVDRLYSYFNHYFLIDNYGSSSAQQTLTFNYNKNYINQTDFSSGVLLNEWLKVPLSVFGDFLYFNSNYSVLPDKVNIQTISKDGNGTITGTSNLITEFEIGYNEDAFISSIKEVDNYATNLFKLTYSK